MIDVGFYFSQRKCDLFLRFTGYLTIQIQRFIYFCFIMPLKLYHLWRRGNNSQIHFLIVRANGCSNWARLPIPYFKVTLWSRKCNVCFSELFGQSYYSKNFLGELLGPGLFSIYMIELVWILSHHSVQFRMFADDTQLYFIINNVEDTITALNSLVCDLKQWMAKKKLKLNEKKTECLLIGTVPNMILLNMMDGNMSPSTAKKLYCQDQWETWDLL